VGGRTVVRHEAALIIAAAEDQDRARAEVHDVLHQLLDAILID
jgi:hypothetical protein